MARRFVSDLSLHDGFGLQYFFLFIPARGTFAQRSGRLTLKYRLGHPHDPLSNSICFLLELIARLADGELGPNLHRAGPQDGRQGVRLGCRLNSFLALWYSRWVG
jgi:hypothetical protein